MTHFWLDPDGKLQEVPMPPKTDAQCIADLLAERDELRQQLAAALIRCADIAAENDRLLPDAKQAHARNDELVSEHLQLKRQIRDLTAARDAALQATRDVLNAAAATTVVLHDATNPEPELVAETRAALQRQAQMPANALRPGDGVPR